jgi:hypothetical protein
LLEAHVDAERKENREHEACCGGSRGGLLTMFYVALVVDIISSVFDPKLNHTTHTSKHNFLFIFF